MAPEYPAAPVCARAWRGFVRGHAGSAAGGHVLACELRMRRASPCSSIALAGVFASASVGGYAALSLTAPARALASPRADPTSGRAVFTGAASTHPTSLHINPGTLGLETGLRVYLASTFTIDQEQVDRQLEDADGQLSEGPSVSELRASPGLELIVTWLPSERIAVGMGLRSAPAERFMSGTGLDSHSRGGGQRDYDFTFAGTFRVTSRFYVGTALSLSSALLPDAVRDSLRLRSSLRLAFSRDTAAAAGSAGLASSCGDGPCGLGNPAAIERYDVDVTPSALLSSLLLGIVVRLGSETFVGITYHTPPGFSVQSSLDGEVDLTRAPRDGGDTVTGQATVDISYPASVEAAVRTPLPLGLLGIAGVRWEDTSRLAEYDVRVHGARLAAVGAPEWIRRARGLRDAVAVWAGAEQTDRELWRFGARLGYERGSVPHDRLAPGNNFSDSITADLGVQWRGRGTRWALQLGYGVAYFLPVSVRDSAYSARNQVACADSGYDFASAECRAARSGYGIESAAGDYHRWQHAFRLGLRYER